MRNAELLPDFRKRVVLVSYVEAGALAEGETEAGRQGDVAAGVDERAGAEEEDVLDHGVLDADGKTMDLKRTRRVSEDAALIIDIQVAPVCVSPDNSGSHQNLMRGVSGSLRLEGECRGIESHGGRP